MREDTIDYDAILETLRAQQKPENVAGMARYGIRPNNTVYGISMPTLRQLAWQIGKDHALAERLWHSGVHEARIPAALVAERKQMTTAQTDEWAQSFDSWDVCDQCCSNLFCKLPAAYAKVPEWCASEAEFVRRAVYVLMATLAVHDKKASDAAFLPFLPLIVAGATDERNFVKKAVNWALRQIGKRNPALNAEAIRTAEQIALIESKAARWIAKEAVRAKLRKG